MKTVTRPRAFTIAAFFTLAKSTVAGLLAAELLFLSGLASPEITSYVEKGDLQGIALLACGFAAVITIAYAFTRGIQHEVLKILRSNRIDVVIATFAGFFVSISIGGIGTAQYSKLARHVLPEYSLAILALSALIATLLTVRAWLPKFGRNITDAPPFFINDTEKKYATEDLLGLADDAARFADSVINGGSKESVVFGIDAPWGIGKSSFINFCIEHWESKNPDGQIVFKFNVLQYADRSNLLEKFVDGLVRSIQRQVFAPELRPIASKYARFIGGKGKVSHAGLSLDFAPGEYTLDDALEDLEGVIGGLDRRLIVIIDDLDRLNFGTVKDVLFAIKKSFTLPNISYVLCYDTENIVAQRDEKTDADKVREFLEKFINVKISLFLDTNTLAKYVTDNFEKAVQNNLLLDPRTVEKTKQAVEAIKKIYEAPDFDSYQSFLGDIRKLKRLINTLVLLEIEKTDFENSDFDKFDLIHLLLVYVNFPNTFRKIYNAETNGRRGFFSLVTESDDEFWEKVKGARHAGLAGAKHFGNSTRFVDFMATIAPDQKFLLNKLFGVGRLDDPLVSAVGEEIKKTYACFNGNRHGGGDRNLEKYLHLIVRLAKPIKSDQYRFYLNCKKQLVDGRAIDLILEAPEFDVSLGERARQQFLRMIVNSADELKFEAGQKVIRYVLRAAPEYSLLEIEKLDIGLRDNLAFFIIKLLDSVGWADSSGNRYENTQENVGAIARWIFGEREHADEGILVALWNEQRGVTGLFDLMVFRLYCSVDRGGNFFNVHRSLALHGDPVAQTAGDVGKLVVPEMREISQRVFGMFKQMYIDRRLNIFAEIDAVTSQDLAGRFWDYAESERHKGTIDRAELERAVATTRTRMKAFITYQLTNLIVGSGVGCGYYDESGTEDGHGISALMNSYLLDFCFDIRRGEENVEFMLDYFLMNFSSSMGMRDGNRYVATVAEFTKILDGKKLAEYWKESREAVLRMGLQNKKKTVYTGNYTATYGEDLSDVFETLDKVVQEFR